MREILVLVEHRQGQIRDITFEMLTKGRKLAEEADAELAAVLLSDKAGKHAETLSKNVERLLLIKDVKLENFNSEAYLKVLSTLINERQPLLTLIGHTSFGVDLAPSLAASLNLPLATDCVDLRFENGALVVTRQIYGGKVNVSAVLRKAATYVTTIRQAAFSAEKGTQTNGEIVEVASPLSQEVRARKRFVEYVHPPPGSVDITSMNVLVGVGRGIKDVSEISSMEELAKALGGALACSRPIVDKGWLPNDRQVGSSGKTVKPKLYIALGISGAFQHVLGIKNSELIIAVNKDSRAPIFNVADYGVVEDLFKIVPSLKSKLSELAESRS